MEPNWKGCVLLMCGGYKVSNRVWTEKPADPSPTPWNWSTWGFFCDHCMMFFDLLEQGKVNVYDDNTSSYEHKACGQPARYIGYDHAVECDPQPRKAKYTREQVDAMNLPEAEAQVKLRECD